MKEGCTQSVFHAKEVTFARFAGYGRPSAALLSGLPAQAQQEMARVISSTPIAAGRCLSRVRSPPGRGRHAAAARSQARRCLDGRHCGRRARQRGRQGQQQCGCHRAGLVRWRHPGQQHRGRRATAHRDGQALLPQTDYESRVSGYNVVYEFGGKQYSAQMPSDPGQYVQLQITPIVPRPPAGYARRLSAAGYAR